MKSQDLTGLMAVMGIFVVTPIALALMFATSQLGGAAITIWIAVAGAVWLTFKGPIGKAIATRLQAEALGADPDGTLQELDELRTRVAELEERQDFSERLLARKDEPQRLEAPRS